MIAVLGSDDSRLQYDTITCSFFEKHVPQMEGGSVRRKYYSTLQYEAKVHMEHYQSEIHHVLARAIIAQLPRII